jgi:pathogenesis-related protein 1
MSWGGWLLPAAAGMVLCAQTQPPSSEAAREILRAHNAARATAGVPPLVWSPRLETMARQWAETLIRTGRFAHNPNSRYGENLFESEGRRISPAQVVQYWTAEAKDYQPGKNACRPGAVCGHYTQVMWRNTRQVGCGSAESGRLQIWVCEYDPPGNYSGQKPF